MKKIITITFFLFVFANTYSLGSTCDQADKKDKDCTEQVEQILEKLNAQNSKIRTYQAKIVYLFIQDPELLDSRTLRTGNIYYKKNDKMSKLLVKFDTFKQDEEKKVDRREEYFFDGIWLRVIDYKNKTINSYQKAREDRPVDAFELISRDFPMIGFSYKEDLRKNFEISKLQPIKNEKDNLIRLKLDVKKGSPYAKNYTSVDFRIDAQTYLPARIITTSTEGDIYDITLSEAKINKKIKDTIFKLETPPDFRENKHPIKKQ